MSLTLSAAELDRIETTLNTLLSPLDFSSLAEWKDKSLSAVRELLGAEKGAFWVSGVDTDGITLSGVPDAAATAYAQHYHTLDESVPVTRAVRGHSALTRGGICRAIGPEGNERYYRSEIYNDWYHPNGLDDAALLIINESEDWPSHPFLPATHAMLSIYDSRREAPGCGERGAALLRLVLPAFAAGVRSSIRLAQHAETLAAALDELPEGVLVVDPDGVTVHRNTTLAKVLEADPERASIELALRAVARAVSAHLQSSAPSSSQPMTRASREVDTAHFRYRVRGTLVGAGVLGSRPLALVFLERTTPQLPSEQVLQERFGVTRREAQVGRLMAQGLTDEAIATTLCISVHTARRHAEAVRRKFGVSSRAEVAYSLLQLSQR